MKNLRYIKLGGLSGAKIAAEHELTRHIGFDNPVIVSCFAKKPTLTIPFLHKPDTCLKLDEVTEDVDIARVDTLKSGGSMFLDNNTWLIHLHVKNTDIGNNDICRILIAITSKVMRKYGINLYSSIHRSNSNDLVVKEDGKDKKIAGTWIGKYNDTHTVFGIFINFKVNYDIMKQAFRMDTEKMKARNTDKIEDVVTGLECENNKEEIIDKIINEVAKRLKFNLLVSELSIKEKDILKNITILLSSKEWIYNAKR